MGRGDLIGLVESDVRRAAMRRSDALKPALVHGGGAGNRSPANHALLTLRYARSVRRRRSFKLDHRRSSGGMVRSALGFSSGF